MNDNNGLSVEMLTALIGMMKNMSGEPHINAVRFMKDRKDVDFAHHADEVEVSIHTGAGHGRYFIWDFARPQDGWVETV